MASTFDLEFGGLDAVYEATGAKSQNSTAGDFSQPVVAPASPAPPKASDAPGKGQGNLFTGLADALNKHQKDLEKRHPGYVADEYVFAFAPPEIGASRVTPPSKPVTLKATAGKKISSAADQVNEKTDSVNVNSQIWPVLAGTQIVQLIDQIMRASTYVTDQQKAIINEDGTQKLNSKATNSGVTAWYKISVTALQLKYDTFRRDNAYRMTFTINAYAINQMCSVFFNDSVYRGPHKAYNYWFTGLNTQILDYEQEYNYGYYTTVTNNSTGLASAPPGGRDQMKQAVLATSEQRTQGQANYVNAAADNAAAFLYSIADFAEVRLKILGDPAWMQQGEVAFGVNARAFEFTPFNSDGSINFDSQQVTFTVTFNRPTDYDYNTGIMDMKANGIQPETFRYQAKTCKNVFSKGSFTQELEGVLIPPNNVPATTSARTAASSAGAVRITNIKGESLGYEVRDETGALSRLRQNEYGDLYDPAGTAGSALPAPRPAPAPKPATSTGDLQNVSSTEFAAFDDALNPAPVARRNFGETDIDFSTQSALVPTPPQPIARDT